MGLVCALLLTMASPATSPPLRVGGDVRAPVVIQRVEPLYTAEAAKARISGIVIVETIIDEHGRVTDVRVLKPLPFGLSEAAVEAVKQWRFRPATLNGEPVSVLFNLTVNFRLPEPVPYLTAAEFTPRDVAVIEAALAAVFPDTTQRLLIATETQALGVPALGGRPLARELEVRNSERHSIRTIDLHRPFFLVSPNAIPSLSEDERKVMITLPGFSADGRTALEVLDLTHLLPDHIEGTRESLLLRNEKGRWVVSQRWSEKTWSSHLPDTRPLRVGGDVKAPIVEQRVEPVYPPEAAKQNIAGIVIIEMVVDASGHVQDARVLKALPFGVSDAVLAAVKQWTFQPGTLNGRPVPVLFNVTVNCRPPREPQP